MLTPIMLHIVQIYICSITGFADARKTNAIFNSIHYLPIEFFDINLS